MRGLAVACRCFCLLHPAATHRRQAAVVLSDSKQTLRPPMAYKSSTSPSFDSCPLHRTALPVNSVSLRLPLLLRAHITSRARSWAVGALVPPPRECAAGYGCALSFCGGAAGVRWSVDGIKCCYGRRSRTSSECGGIFTR